MAFSSTVILHTSQDLGHFSSSCLLPFTALAAGIKVTAVFVHGKCCPVIPRDSRGHWSWQLNRDYIILLGPDLAPLKAQLSKICLPVGTAVQSGMLHSKPTKAKGGLYCIGISLVCLQCPGYTLCPSTAVSEAKSKTKQYCEIHFHLHTTALSGSKWNTG